MLKKKLLALIFTINFAFLATVPSFQNISPVSISYAEEDKISTQREHYKKELKDSEKIFASKAYRLINKESLKAEYK